MANTTPQGKRDAIALDLAAGQRIAGAAAKHQVGERTIRRWLAEDDAFRKQVDSLRQELFDAATGRACRLSGRAIRELGKLLSASSERIRLQAARAILEVAPRLRETTELAQRLEEIEETLRRTGQGTRARRA